MDITPELIRLFAPTPIYGAVKLFAMWVLQYVTPILLGVAIWIRITETQIEGFSGQARWAAALKDFFWWGFILGGYFLFGAMVAELFNAFYGMFDDKGSLSVIYHQMEAFINKMNAMEKTDGGLAGAAINLLTAPFTFLAFAVYYLSLLFVTFIIMFMRVAVALGFGVVFVWGLIAIPLAMTSNFRFLRGWGLLAAGIAVWPVVESIFMGLFSPVLTQAASGLFSGGGTTFNLEKAGVYFIYSLLNIFIAVIVIAAPIITASLVANSQALTGMVAPFVGGAFAATAAAMQVSKHRISNAVGAARQGMGNAGGAAMQSLHSKISPFAGASSGSLSSATYSPVQATNGYGFTGKQSASSGASGGRVSGFGPASDKTAKGGYSFAGKPSKPKEKSGGYSFAGKQTASPSTVNTGGNSGARAPGSTQNASSVSSTNATSTGNAKSSQTGPTRQGPASTVNAEGNPGARAPGSTQNASSAPSSNAASAGNAKSSQTGPARQGPASTVNEEGNSGARAPGSTQKSSSPSRPATSRQDVTPDRAQSNSNVQARRVAAATAATSAAGSASGSVSEAESGEKTKRRRDPEKARRGVFINKSIKRRDGGG